MEGPRGRWHWKWLHIIVWTKYNWKVRGMFAIHALTAIWCLAQQGWFPSSSSCSCSSPSSSGSTFLISSSPIHFLFQQFQPTVLLLEGDDYTKLGLAVVVLILEGLHAVCYRRVLKDKNSSDHYQLCFISLSCSGRAWSWTGCVHPCSSTWWLSVLLFGFLNWRWQILGVQCTVQFNCHYRGHQ